MFELGDELRPDESSGQARHLHLLLEAVPQGLALLDEKGHLLHANNTARQYLRLLLPDATPLSPLHPIQSLHSTPLQTLLDARRHEIFLDSEHEPRRFAVTAHPVPVPTPRPPDQPAWALIIRDITERERQSEETRQKERLAAVGQLAAGIAHDFNNILSSIVLYSQLLETETQLSEAGQRRLQIIREQTTRASELVRQLLDFSRRSVMQRQEVDMVALCHELAQSWRSTFPPTIDINVHHHAERYPVEGDPSRLKQALLNLAINAREAMPRGGRLTLSLSHRRIGPNDTVPRLGMDPGLWLQITVSDSGNGIPPESLPHIFEPFFSTKPLHEGAGLGLPQVHGIVHQHGGTVKIDSEPHKGTVVTIYLPLRDQAATLPTATPQTTHTAVLLIEPDDRLRHAMSQSLQAMIDRLDHRLFLLGDGQEAIDLVRRQSLRPLLIIGDLAMPRMSGLTLLQTMRTHNPDCRMIIISNYPRPQNDAHLRAAGIAVWLSKPFSMDDLRREIQKLLAA